MSRLLGSNRLVGLLLVAVPVLLGLVLFLFPNYDARPDYFASSYSSIPDAGVAFPLSLAVMVIVSLVIGVLILGLRRTISSDSGGMSFVVLALGASGVGLLVAALLSIPVALWASQVNNGSLGASDAAGMSQTFATTAQTLVLLVGLGGMLVGMTVLGVLCRRRGLVNPVVFWATIVAAVAVLVGGFTAGLFWLAIGGPVVLWTAMVGSSLAIKNSSNTRT